ncbi:MAG: ATP-dependent DNA helicase RecG [Oscillospiraceae bacterium]
MPQISDLQKDVRYLKGVGECRAELLSKLGVTTVDALLRFYPRSYIDLSDCFCVADAPLNETCAIRARVYSKSAPIRAHSGKTLYKVHAGDDSGELELVFFNNKFAPAALENEREYVFYGKTQGSLLRRQMMNPMVIQRKDANYMVPVYPLTAGISSKVIAACVKSAFLLCGDALEETLCEELRMQFSLIGRREAIEKIHFPKSAEEAADAKRRLIFEELLTLSLGMKMLRSKARSEDGIVIPRVICSEFISNLPFELTGAQKRSIAEICEDLKAKKPMNRLLQGDVGSGKTAVAAVAVFCAWQSGFQSAVMAPTEILARQHAKTFEKFFEPYNVTIGLLTSSLKGKKREQLLEKAANGEIDLLIGTHAVIGQNVKFNSLGLVIADEQHRFGVKQRAELLQKGEHPNLLVMSATPIPRTLALIIYGDLDISVLDELPPGRKRVRTLLVTDKLRDRYLGFVRKIVGQGHQAYIVCPLVDDSEALEKTLSATEYKNELERKYLKDVSVGLIHGKLKSAEKEKVMQAFKDKKISVLVSTTVIEVGVDVPNAVLMIIENAERFGLSTLHQLRGRVGRGADESYCVLVSSSVSGISRERLEIMTRTADGFEIARCDLKARGPGDFFGHRQHGLPELAIADLVGDERALHEATAAAQLIFDEDPTLVSKKNLGIKREVEQMFAEKEAEFN